MKKKGKKKVAAAPLVAKKAAEPKKVVNPLLEKRPRNFGIGKHLNWICMCACPYKHIIKIQLIDNNGCID